MLQGGNRITTILKLGHVRSTFFPGGWWMAQMQCPPHVSAIRHLHLECHELIRRPCQQCLLIFWFSHNQFFYIARCTNSELKHHQQDCIWTSPSCKPFLRRISNSLHVVVKWFHNCIGVLSCMGDVLISNAPHPCFWQLMLIQVVVEASWIRIIGFQLLKLLFDPQDRFYMKWTISGIHDVFKSK